MKATERTFIRLVFSLQWQRRRQMRARLWLGFQLAVLYVFVVWLMWKFLKVGGVL